MTYRCLTNHTHTLMQHTNKKGLTSRDTKYPLDGGVWGGWPPHRVYDQISTIRILADLSTNFPTNRKQKIFGPPDDLPATQRYAQISEYRDKTVTQPENHNNPN